MSFRQKIFVSYALVFIFIAALLYPLITHVIELIQQRNLKKEVVALIDEVKEASSVEALIEALKQEEKHLFFRVSLIEPSDGLLYDSTNGLGQNVMREEDHLAHPEVNEAVNTQVGYNVRFSPLFNQEVAFLAVSFEFLDKDYVLRAGFPYGRINAIKRDFRLTFLGILIFVLLLFCFMAWLIVHYLTLPIEQITAAIRPYQLGEQDEIPKISIESKAVAKDEFGQLAETLNSLSTRIRQQINTLTSERNDKEDILESLGEGVIAVDELMTVIFCNEIAEKFLKLKKEEIVGRSFAVVQQNEMHSLIRDASETGKPVSEVIIPSEKPRRYVEAMAVPRKKGAGTILVLQDKTSIYKVIELGRDFIANASHELKTPITIIQGFAETLHEHPELSREVSSEITEKIVSNCERMHILVRNLLTLAALDEGIPSSRQMSVDLCDLMDQAKNTLLAVHSDAQITIEAKTTPVALLCDSDLLYQAFLNLLDNGAKYSTPPAKIRVTLESSDDEIKVCISDQGIGIPAEELDVIFERFYAVDKSHSKALGGSGLGLSIVERIIERHNGSIHVDSTPKVGTTFTITFPTKTS